MKKNTAFLNIGWPYLHQTYTIIFLYKKSKVLLHYIPKLKRLVNS